MPKRNFKSTVINYFDKFDDRYIAAHMGVLLTISGLFALSAYATAGALVYFNGLGDLSTRLWTSLVLIIGAPLLFLFARLSIFASFEDMEPPTEENLNDPEYLEQLEVLDSGASVMPSLITVATIAAVIVTLSYPLFSSLADKFTS